MPHQCTNCQRSFPDGSKQMLSGCPDCGGKKFQFIPSEKADTAADPSSEPEPQSGPTPDSDSEPASTSTAPIESSAGSPTASRTDPTDDDFDAWPDESQSAPPTPDDDGIIEAPEEPLEDGTSETGPEDLAQADARRTVVDDDELPEHDDKTVVDIPDAEDPSLSELREELNDQFESIKVLEPGQYELNLMELYDRPEHIIAIEEDGRYVIDVADVGEKREQ
ncbi:MAG: Zn-ribbon containing protein [Halobacteriales archaeon]